MVFGERGKGRWRRGRTDSVPLNHNNPSSFWSFWSFWSILFLWEGLLLLALFSFLGTPLGSIALTQHSFLLCFLSLHLHGQ